MGNIEVNGSWVPELGDLIVRCRSHLRALSVVWTRSSGWKLKASWRRSVGGCFEDEQDFSRKRQEFGVGRVRGQCFPDSLWQTTRFYFVPVCLQSAVNMARHCKIAVEVSRHSLLGAVSGPGTTVCRALLVWVSSGEAEQCFHTFSDSTGVGGQEGWALYLCQFSAKFRSGQKGC